MKKELLVLFRSKSIGILVPKQRGEGFLKVPLGHHNCPLSQLARDIGYDIFGLDGELEIQTGYIEQADYAKMQAEVIQPISELTGFAYRVVQPEEYYSHRLAGHHTGR